MLQSFLTVGQQILTLYLLLVVGFVLGKVKLLDDRASVALSSLVMYVVSPCMMVVAFQRPLEHTALHNFGVVTGVSAVLHVVFIAAAMLLNPRVLFADEPTSALDVTIQKQVVEEMLLVHRTFGTSIVLVTHNLGVIGAMADRILVLKDGEALEYGKTQDVLTNPQSDYTRALLAAVPKLRR